jgi:hypothetical protein
METMVSESTTNLMEQDHTGNITYAYTPVLYINQAWRYGYGLWTECHQPKWDQNCAGIYSSPGLYGFYPWIDRKNNYYGIVGTYNPTDLIAVSPQLGQIIQPLIESALNSGSSSTSDSSSSSGTATSGTTTTGVATTASVETGMAVNNVVNFIYLILLIACLF